MSAASAAAAGQPGGAGGFGSRTLGILQRIGRSLMMPIAVLPAAALLLRFGQADLLGAEGLASVGGFGWVQPIADVFSAAGDVLFDNLAFLFAIGVAIGFARRSDGSTALAALVGYLVFDRVSMTLFGQTALANPDSPLAKKVLVTQVQDGEPTKVINFAAGNPSGVVGGIVIGVTAALLYQRFYRVKLPQWLAFFGGRRFVPIITSLAAVVLGVAFGLVWPFIGAGINAFGEWMLGLGAVGTGIYGVVNRLLIPFGLHHIVNTLVWYTFGTYNGPEGTVHGVITRYFAGDPNAGSFLAGFFPIMMFGLPAAALAIWRAAPPHRRATVGGLMFSAAFASFLTGVTEPIEFSFMFVAPVLYVIHALLTGLVMAITAALGAAMAFGFSAGAIDFILNFSKANTDKPLLMLLIGLIVAVVYYVVFYFAITWFNLKTPGREPEDEAATATADGSDAPASASRTPEASGTSSGTSDSS